ncbi:MAG: response regulator, partial [Terriglobia bacterium]
RRVEPQVGMAVEFIALSEEAEARLRAATVLVVEDEEPVRKVVREFLESMGYSVLEARDGGEAMQIAGGHPGPIHLLVTDVVMPGMGGPELARGLKPLRPDLKVLYMSGYPDNARGQHGAFERGAAVLHKPFTLDELARKVRDVLES